MAWNGTCCRRPPSFHSVSVDAIEYNSHGTQRMPLLLLLRAGEWKRRMSRRSSGSGWPFPKGDENATCLPPSLNNNANTGGAYIAVHEKWKKEAKTGTAGSTFLTDQHPQECSVPQLLPQLLPLLHALATRSVSLLELHHGCECFAELQLLLEI